MKKVYARPRSLKNVPNHYCPGCGHSIMHRLIAEVLDEMDLREKAICVPPAGCAVLAYDYIDIDMVEAPHGRGAAVATGIKRVRPENLVFSYQGDGDLAAIGTAETLHAANRGEQITIFFVNNAVYGMTGGQMAPTTLLGMKTTTSPTGRTVETAGFPLKISDMVAMLPGTAYVTRQSVHTPNAVRQLKKALTKAFQHQKEGKGTCFIEVVSNCPSGWKMTPVQANEWLVEHMLPLYPPGDIKVPK